MTQLISVLHYTGGQLDAGKQVDIVHISRQVTWKVPPIRHYRQTSRLVPFMLTGMQGTGYCSRSYFPSLSFFFPVYLLVALVVSYIFYLFIFFLTWDLLLLARL